MEKLDEVRKVLEDHLNSLVSSSKSYSENFKFDGKIRKRKDGTYTAMVSCYLGKEIQETRKYTITKNEDFGLFSLSYEILMDKDKKFRM